MNLLINADARQIPLADRSVHCIVTSPPYFGLRDYGVPGQIGLEPTPDDFVQAMVAVGRQLWRVLRDDGTWWLNLGDSYATTPNGRSAVDTKLIGKDDRTFRDLPMNTMKASGLKSKNLLGIPWMVAFALRNDGWILRQDIIWHKPNPMPESVKDRCTKAHEYIFLLTKSARYYYDNEAVKEDSTQHPTDWENGEPKRPSKVRGDFGGKNTDPGKEAFRTITPTRNRRSVWTVTTKPYPGSHYATFPPDLIEPCILAGTSEKGVCPKCGAPWERVVEKGLTAHDGKTETGYQEGMTANRLALLRQAARERGGEYSNQSTTIGWQPTCDCGIEETVPATVLDPFAGSGTTLMVARKHGRNGIGLDLSFDYLNTNARERLVYGGFVPVADGVNQLTIDM